MRKRILSLFLCFCMIFSQMLTGVVSAESGAASKVTIATGVTNGTISASAASANEGETVVLTVAPNAGYAAAAVKVATDAAKIEVEVTEQQSGTYSFTMPAEAVSVTAEFVKVPLVLGGINAKNVCKIGTTEYPSIAAALKHGGTDSAVVPAGEDRNNPTRITLIADATENVVVPEGRFIILDLGGYVLYGTGSGSVIVVQGVFTLDDTSTEKTGKVTNGRTANGGGVYVIGSASFTLNGGTITGNTATANGGGVYVIGSASFTLNGGAIAGNTAVTYGGGVYVTGGSTVTMNGGEITKNASWQGGGLYTGANRTTVSLLGGAITENSATNMFGGVLLNANGGKTYTIGGNIKICGNTLEGTADNLVMWDAAQASLIVDAQNPLRDGAEIHITLMNGGKRVANDVTNANGKDYSAYFKSDSAGYKIYNIGVGTTQKVKLSQHEHTWNYEADSTNKDTLKAWCSENFGSCVNYGTVKAQTVKIQAPAAASLTYDGTNKPATLSKTAFGGLTLSADDITYKQKTQTNTWKDLTGKPKEAGTYQASITVGSGTDAKIASVEYTIAKAEIEVPTAETGLVYTGSEQIGAVLPNGAKYKLSDNAKVDAGDYKAIAVLNDKTNYVWKNKGTSDNQEIAWSIAKALPVAEDFNFAEPTNTICDGSKKAANVTTTKTGMGAITVKYYADAACTTPAEPKTAGTYYVGISVAAGSNYSEATLIRDSSWRFTIGLKAADDFPITGIQSEKTYTGFAITQDITIKDGTKTLILGTDYDIVYTNNVNVGTAKLTVQYKGNYSGTGEETFTINPRQLSVSETAVETAKVYDAKTEITVASKGILQGVQGGDVIEFTAAANFADKNVGANKPVTIVYTISGDKAGNYIKPADNTALTASITAKQLSITAPVIGVKTYDGTATAQATRGMVSGVETGDNVAVTVASATFDNASVGTDKNVTVKYALSNTDCGNYTLADSVVKAGITAKSLTDDMIAEIKAEVYSGSAVEPSVTVTYKMGDGTTRTLTKGIDYTVAYSNNIKAGQGKVTVTGKGSYAGTTEKSFSIARKSIAGAKITLKGDILVATGDTLIQEIEKVEIDGVELVAGRDYCIKNDSNVIQKSAAGKYPLTIMGMNNYDENTSAVVYFLIAAPQDTKEVPNSIGEEVTEKYGNGYITAKTVVADDTPQTFVLMSIDDLIEATATADEMKIIESGGKINVWLQVEKVDNVQPEVEQAIASVIGNKKVGCYLDVRLFKEITDTQGRVENSKLEKVNGNKSITIAVKISDALAADNENFGIARYHNGKGEVLDSVYDADSRILRFSTDKFSDYAIIMTPTTDTDTAAPTAALLITAILIAAAVLTGLGWILWKKRSEKR